MTADTLEGRIESVRLAALESRQWRRKFEAAICQAHEAGIPLRDIALAAGLSHQRVHQIVKGV